MLDEYIRQIPSNQETELCETFQKPLPHASFHPSLSIITIIFIFISNNYLVCKKCIFHPKVYPQIRQLLISKNLIYFNSHLISTNFSSIAISLEFMLENTGNVMQLNFADCIFLVRFSTFLTALDILQTSGWMERIHQLQV